jgi:hypothetical protein
MRRKSNHNELKAINLGCGKQKLCLKCGTAYSKKKAISALSLSNALFEAFPSLHIASWVLTIPHGHEIAENESLSNYSKLFVKARKLIQTFFPKCASLLVLHNWSSKYPDERHIHIHAIIFSITEEKQLLHAFHSAEAVRSVWKNLLQTPEEPVVWLQFYRRDDWKKVVHMIRYVLRSPINDYTNRYGMILTDKYLMRMSKLHHVQRARWTGWMANRRRKIFLGAWNLNEIDLKDISDWECIQYTQAELLPDGRSIILQDGTMLLMSQIADLNSVPGGKIYSFSARAGPSLQPNVHQNRTQQPFRQTSQII